jgi:methionyl-tRNA formyltransferase
MNSKDLRIVYMGTPDFAVAPLKALVEGGYNIVAVVTTPDKPSGRGLKVNESAVKKYAQEVGLPILQPVKLRDEAFVQQFRALDADLGIVIAFRMLPEIIWAAPRLGTFNLHASLLPQLGVRRPLIGLL